MDICHDFSAFKNFLEEEEKRRRRRKRRKIVDENINLDKLVQIIVTVTGSSTGLQQTQPVQDSTEYNKNTLFK